MTTDLLREEIGRLFGLPTAVAQLLQGETREEVEADAKAFHIALGVEWSGEAQAWMYADPQRFSAEMRRRREARAERMRRESEREGDAVITKAMRDAGLDGGG